MEWPATQPAVLAVAVIQLVMGDCAHTPPGRVALDAEIRSADGVDILTSLEAKHAQGGER